MRLAAVLAIGLAAAVGATAAVRSGPALRLVSRAPLVVRGSGFQPGERVRVVEVAPARRVVLVHARAAGGFTVSLVAGDRCSAMSVFATGASGDGARLKAPPPPECAPASTP